MLLLVVAPIVTGQQLSPTSPAIMKTPSQLFHDPLIRDRDSQSMTKNTTRALTLLATVPATLALVIGVGAGAASAQTPDATVAPTAAGQGVIHYDGLFDDLDDLFVPHHIRHQINAAVGSLGVEIPWHLLDGLDDDQWDDDHDDRDDRDDWDD